MGGERERLLLPLQASEYLKSLTIYCALFIQESLSKQSHHHFKKKPQIKSLISTLNKKIAKQSKHTRHKHKKKTPTNRILEYIPHAQYAQERKRKTPRPPPDNAQTLSATEPVSTSVVP